MLSGEGGETMSTVPSVETVSELTNQLQNLDDVQRLFDRFLQADQLFTNRELLRSTYIPGMLPHREKEITELANILSPAVNLEAPSNVLLFGKPGIGKTAVVKLVGGELQKRGDALGKEIRCIYINCHLTDSLYKILTQIGQQFTGEQGGAIPSSGLPADVLLTKIISCIDTRKQVLLVVLDEIDRIKDDAALYTLTRMNEQLRLARVSLIGISNNLRFTDFLDARVNSSLGQETMVFNPYDAQQLQDILRVRCEQALRPNVLSDEVIPLCAALAAQEHGDARRALDFLRVSVELAERKHDRLVTGKHVRLAQNKIERDRITEVVHNLPAQERLVLHAISRLQQYHDRMETTAPITTGEIYHQYTDLAKAVQYTRLTQRRIADFISELDTLGIITAEKISKGRHGTTREVRITSSAAALVAILREDELFKELEQVKSGNQTRLV
jgi:cell division control protein 6